MNQAAIEILLLDNRADAGLTCEMLRRGKVCNPVRVVTDGTEALTCLRCEGRWSGSTRPGLLLIDANLPNAEEVLAECASNPDLRDVPVVVLTATRADEDRARSHGHPEGRVLAKPVGLYEFLAVVRAVDDLWLEVVELPPELTRRP